MKQTDSCVTRPHCRLHGAILAAGLWLLSNPGCPGGQQPLDAVNQLEVAGKFKQAAITLTEMLKEKGLAADERTRLEFELDRLERIRKDFPYSRDDLFAELK